MHLNCPPWLEKMLIFSSLKWLNALKSFLENVMNFFGLLYIQSFSLPSRPFSGGLNPHPLWLWLRTMSTNTDVNQLTDVERRRPTNRRQPLSTDIPPLIRGTNYVDRHRCQPTDWWRPTNRQQTTYFGDRPTDINQPTSTTYWPTWMTDMDLLMSKTEVSK